MQFFLHKKKKKRTWEKFAGTDVGKLTSAYGNNRFSGG